MLVMVSEEILLGRVLCFPLPSLGDVPLFFNDFCIVSIRLLLTPCIDTNALKNSGMSPWDSFLCKLFIGKKSHVN
ncbi:hypothetical protein C0J52_02483 [Blattella germanica]|nr:hypothetical protein C0J52_02483 [Blattella germanica]